MDTVALVDALFATGEDYVVLLDPQLGVVRASGSWVALTDGRGFLDSVEGGSQARARAALQRTGPSRRTVFIDHVERGGEARRIGWRLVPLPEGVLLLGRDTGDETRRLSHILRLHRELHHETRRARRAEAHDPLTGLHARKEAIVAAASLWAQSASGSVLLLDLDHLKEVNRRHGHAAGDVLLQTIARALRAAVPEGAVVGRWDGDTFVVVVGDDAQALAGRLLDTVRNARVEGPEGSVGVTASIGAALVAEPGRVPLDDALHAADAALNEVRQTDQDMALVRHLRPRHRGEGPPGNERRSRQR